ncbi:MAG: hypothetical protein GC186_05445 [Rhodobacteraceae bacterium]|nr:hypothetical protein [Paracoccaceae bacterium]
MTAILRLSIWIAFALVMAWADGAEADQENPCQGVATGDVAPIGTSGPVLHRGDIFDAVSQYVTFKDGRPPQFCSPGPCYPASAIVLTTCKVDDTKPGETYGDETYFGVTIIRSRVSPDVLRISDVFGRLADLGVDHADAGNAATTFVKMPFSACASVVQGALEGDPAAVALLNSSGQSLCPP